MTHPARTLPVSDARPVRGRRAYLADRSDGTRRHAGVDLGAPPGSPVLAPERGLVVAVARSTPAPPGVAAWPVARPWTGYGPAVVLLQGESGRWHLLSHVAWPVRVADGASVERGEHVADVSHLAHVHWEVRTRPNVPRGVATSDVTLDPLAWLEGQDVGSRSAPVADTAEREPAPAGVMTHRGASSRSRGLAIIGFLVLVALATEER